MRATQTRSRRICLCIFLRCCSSWVGFAQREAEAADYHTVTGALTSLYQSSKDYCLFYGLTVGTLQGQGQMDFISSLVCVCLCVCVCVCLCACCCCCCCWVGTGTGYWMFLLPGRVCVAIVYSQRRYFPLHPFPTLTFFYLHL